MAPTQNDIVPNYSANYRSIVLPAHLHSLHGLVFSAYGYAGTRDLVPVQLDPSENNICCLGAVLGVHIDFNRCNG